MQNKSLERIPKHFLHFIELMTTRPALTKEYWQNIGHYLVVTF